MSPSKVEANLLAASFLEARGIRFRTLTEFRWSEAISNDVEASLVRMSRISLTKTGVAAVDEDEDTAVDKDKDDGGREGRVKGDQDGDIPEPSHRLLRGP